MTRRFGGVMPVGHTHVGNIIKIRVFSHKVS